MIQNCNLIYDTDSKEFRAINQSTGETIVLMSMSKPVTKSAKKTAVPESTEPTVILETNKLTINSAAQTLLDVKPGDGVLLDYIKVPTGLAPYIKKDTAGNKLTKSGTIACRGQENQRLSDYGSTFKIVLEDGRYMLKGDKIVETENNESISEPDDEITQSLLKITGDDYQDAVEISSADFASLIDDIN